MTLDDPDLLKVNHSDLHLPEDDPGELDHEKHLVGATLLVVVHQLNLAERQPVEPVHLEQTTISVFLAQLSTKNIRRVSTTRKRLQLIFAGTIPTTLVP